MPARPGDRAMEADVLWKAAMRPRLPTGLGKRPPTTTRVSHISHSPYHRKEKQSGNQNQNLHQECYLCLRANVLPMFQVAHRRPDEGAFDSCGTVAQTAATPRY